jgi:hypothetical protein
MKATGLLTYLLSKPDGWKVIVKDISNHFKDGRDSIYSGLRELKQNGYYKKAPVRDEQGRILYWESIIYECPDMTQTEQPPLPVKKKSEKSPILPLVTGFPDLDNPDLDNPYMENPQHNNININKNESNQNDVSIYQSEQTNKNEKTKKEFDNDTASRNDLIDTSNKIIKVYSKQELTDKISYDELKTNHPDKTEELEIIFEILCEVLTVDNPISPTFRISKQNIPFITAKHTFDQIQKEHIEYVLHSLNNNDNKFKINKNTKSYVMTALFHAPRTITYYFDRKFKQKPAEKSKWEIAVEQKIERDRLKREEQRLNFESEPSFDDFAEQYDDYV